MRTKEEDPEAVLRQWAELHNKVLGMLHDRFSDIEINTFALVAVAKMLRDTTKERGVKYADENLLGTISYLATSEEIIWTENPE